MGESEPRSIKDRAYDIFIRANQAENAAPVGSNERWNATQNMAQAARIILRQESGIREFEP